MLPDSTFDEIVAGFYRAACGAITWGEAILPVQQAVSAFLVQLHAVDVSQGSVVFSYEVGPASAQGVLDYILRWHRADPRGDLLMSMEAGQTMNCWEHFDEAFVATAPFYQEFLLPYGGRYASGTKLLQDGPINAFLGVHRGLGSQPLNADELALCQRFSRHLTEALKLYRANVPQTQAGHLGIELIGRLRAPLALLDDRRQILHLNAAARALLAGSNALNESEGSLYCRRQREDNALLMALRDLHLAGTSQLHASAADKAYLRVGSPAGDEDISLFLYALRPESTLHVFGERSLAMVLFHTSDTRIELDPFVVAAAFDLTPGEARTAVALAEGHALEEIAMRHALSIHTVRTQLRSIFAKTGVSRQGELVSRLASLPMAALNLGKV